MGGLMTVIYTFTDSRGINHDIHEQDIQESFRILMLAGFDMHQSHEMSLDYLLAKLQIGSIPEVDLMYRAHEYAEEDRLCGMVATRLAQRSVNL